MPSTLAGAAVVGGLILVGLLLCTLIVYRTGGTQYAYPYLILLPVIAAGAAFKLPGGLSGAIVAALLLGPWMPLDASSGTMQSTHNWLLRMGLYLGIGGFTGVIFSYLDFSHRRVLALQRIDPASGLISPRAASDIAASHAGSSRALADRAQFQAVVVEFDGHFDVVLAMGSATGDEVLRRLGEALAEVGGTTFPITRLHAATFGAFIPGGRLEAMRFVNHCRQRVPEAMQVGDVPLMLIPRFGIAPVADGEISDRLPFRKALVALHEARDRGRVISRYNSARDVASRDVILLLSKFREDLEAGRCLVHVQPKLDLVQDRILGVETLIRWSNSELGEVSPGLFIPLVERTLLIHAVTRFMIDRAAALAADWRRQGLDLVVGINLSVKNLQDEDLVQYLLDAPRKFGVPHAGLELEITETALMNGVQTARQALRRLRSAGYSIAIDDFGTGHSSLSYLKELPLDWVKLDQSFVRDLPDDAASREIAAATAVMCNRLGYRVIAEGVESADAVELLRDQGYDAIQGYHLARPMPPERLPDWLSAWQARPAAARAPELAAQL